MYDIDEKKEEKSDKFWKDTIKQLKYKKLVKNLNKSKTPPSKEEPDKMFKFEHHSNPYHEQNLIDEFNLPSMEEIQWSLPSWPQMEDHSGLFSGIHKCVWPSVTDEEIEQVKALAAKPKIISTPEELIAYVLSLPVKPLDITNLDKGPFLWVKRVNGNDV